MMYEEHWSGWGGMLFGPFGMVIGLVLLVVLIVVIVRALDR